MSKISPVPCQQTRNTVQKSWATIKCVALLELIMPVLLENALLGLVCIFSMIKIQNTLLIE